jgi:shikimate kinase
VTDRVLLLGLMGSGKSTIGRLLASRTGWPYLDNDDLLRDLAGADAETVSRQGAEALHRLEARVVLDLIARPAPLVAGLAASVVENDEVRWRVAAEALGVYLRARVDTLRSRLGTGAGRPWLAPDPRTVLTRQLARRDPLFRQAARLVVDVDGATPDQIADRILAGIG